MGVLKSEPGKPLVCANEGWCAKLLAYTRSWDRWRRNSFVFAMGGLRTLGLVNSKSFRSRYFRGALGGICALGDLWAPLEKTWLE